MTNETSLLISEDIISVTVAEEVTTIDITPTVTNIEARGLSIATATAGSLPFTPHGSITATTVQGALQQLAEDQDQTFSSPNVPEDPPEGSTWYDTATEEFKIYRETSSGVFEWVPIIVGSSSGDSDTLDAGAF
jgi:hypothetical protein